MLERSTSREPDASGRAVNQQHASSLCGQPLESDRLGGGAYDWRHEPHRRSGIWRREPRLLVNSFGAVHNTRLSWCTWPR